MFVDTYAVRGAAERLEVLALRRGTSGRCPGSWETVHGTIESGETPVLASLRELREETGLAPQKLYNLSRTEGSISIAPTSWRSFLCSSRSSHPMHG
jgi:8-oxo-dGTP pyrophosphatase MutT (NUDIX family)